MPVARTLYADLKRLARRRLARERMGHTLGPTALAHEAYLRLVEQPPAVVAGRQHLLALAARVMRRVLVEHARARQAQKRGGKQVVDELPAEVPQPEREAHLVRVDEALERLAAIDPDQVRVVELRYFGGMTIEETAAVLGSSPATVKREWAHARAWLGRELRLEQEG